MNSIFVQEDKESQIVKITHLIFTCRYEDRKISRSRSFKKKIKQVHWKYSILRLRYMALVDTVLPLAQKRTEVNAESQNKHSVFNGLYYGVCYLPISDFDSLNSIVKCYRICSISVQFWSA